MISGPCNVTTFLLHVSMQCMQSTIFVLPVLSIRLPVLCLNNRTYHHTFLTIWQGRSSLLSPTAVAKFQGEPLSGVMYGGGKFANIALYLENGTR